MKEEEYEDAEQLASESDREGSEYEPERETGAPKRKDTSTTATSRRKSSTGGKNKPRAPYVEIDEDEESDDSDDQLLIGAEVSLYAGNSQDFD